MSIGLAYKELLEKKSSFSPHKADIQLKSFTHQQIILVEYQFKWMKIVDFFTNSIFSIQSYLLFLIPYSVNGGSFRPKSMTLSSKGSSKNYVDQNSPIHLSTVDMR